MVGPTGLVTFQGHRYSMPPEAIGVHEQGRDSIHPQERTARLAPVVGARGRLYLKRQKILDMGPTAEAFL